MPPTTVCPLVITRLVVSLAALATLPSCSAPFWQGVAAGLGSYGQTSYAAPKAARPDASTTLCVKYMTAAGWSQGYRVQATVVKGAELNRRTSSFNYNALSTYVVVFWDPGEASLLELDYYFGSISALGHDATDQLGRAWRVSSGLCY